MERLEEVGLLTLPRVGTEILVYTPEEVATAQEQGNYFIVGEILAKGKTLYRKEADHARAILTDVETRIFPPPPPAPTT
jgi:hypothetical protein